MKIVQWIGIVVPLLMIGVNIAIMVYEGHLNYPNACAASIIFGAWVIYVGELVAGK